MLSLRNGSRSSKTGNGTPIKFRYHGGALPAQQVSAIKPGLAVSTKNEEVVNEYIIFVDIEIKDGMIDQALPLVIESAEMAMKNEPGCMQFDVVQDNANPNRVMLFEVYKDEAAFQFHGKQPYVPELMGKVRPMFAKSSMTKMTRRAHPTK